MSCKVGQPSDDTPVCMSEAQQTEAAHFRARVEHLAARDGGKDGFDRELEVLLALDHRTQTLPDVFFSGSLGSSLSKNRFDEVLPNEHTLVRLHASDSSVSSYINANFVDCRGSTFGVPYVYIVTQAPLPNTVLDFWRMVVQENVSFIVMLCGTKENGKRKSEVYWPQNSSSTISAGAFTVQMVSQEVHNDLVRRIFCITETCAVVECAPHDGAAHGGDFFTLHHDGSSRRSVAVSARQVYHVQYLGWPDMGLPKSSRSLMTVIHELDAFLASSRMAAQDAHTRFTPVRDVRDDASFDDDGLGKATLVSPVVVHCSGGVGRSGVFVALHIALSQFHSLHDQPANLALSEKQPQHHRIDIPAIVAFLKLCRTGMVGNREQYVFLYYALLREMNRMTRCECNSPLVECATQGDDGVHARPTPSSSVRHREALEGRGHALPWSDRSPPTAQDGREPSSRREMNERYPYRGNRLGAINDVPEFDSISASSPKRRVMWGPMGAFEPPEAEAAARAPVQPFIQECRKRSFIQALVHRLFHRDRKIHPDHFGVAEILPVRNYNAMNHDIALMKNYLAQHRKARHVQQNAVNMNLFCPDEEGGQGERCSVVEVRKSAPCNETASCEYSMQNRSDRASNNTGSVECAAVASKEVARRSHAEIIDGPGAVTAPSPTHVETTHTEPSSTTFAATRNRPAVVSRLSSPSPSLPRVPSNAPLHDVRDARDRLIRMSHNARLVTSPCLASHNEYRLDSSREAIQQQASSHQCQPQFKNRLCPPFVMGRHISSYLGDGGNGYGRLTAEEMDLL